MQHLRVDLRVLWVIILVTLLLGFATQSSMAAPSYSPTLAITSPGTTLAEMDEFATTAMGDPWDMNQTTDLAFYRSESQLVNSNFANGIYSAQMTNGNGAERITLLTAGAQSNAAMRVGKIGYNYPINADYYRYLTFRLYSTNTNCTSGLMQWYADDSYSSAVMGVSNGFLVPPAPCIGQPAGWYIYTLDLKTIGIQQGSKNWSGTIRELIIHPFAGTGAAGATVKLDWARLTAADPRTARPYTIQWSGSGSGGSVTLYANPNTPTLNADSIVIATGQSAGGGSFVFQTGVLPAGSYYIAASNNSGTAWSSSPLVINAPPQVSITKPSMTSGQEYATTEMGNPWDMNDVRDLNYNLPGTSPTCVSGASFSNGLYSAVEASACGGSYADPIMYLGGMDRFPPGTPDPTVDTNKYRYLSYRFYQEGQQSVAMGWVTRFGWWQVNATDNAVTQSPVMGRDIIILEGWNNYKLDLWAPDAVDETYPPGTPNWRQAQPNRLRLDPNELHSSFLPSAFHLDWIKLTAMDEVARGSQFSIQYTVNSPQAVTLSFYYDTDTNPSNGRTLIGTKSFSAASQASAGNKPGITTAPTARYMIYLPSVSKGGCTLSVPTQAGEDAPNGCYDWDTSAAPLGTYYICIAAQDPYNASYRCSEAPVVVH